MIVYVNAEAEFQLKFTDISLQSFQSLSSFSGEKKLQMEEISTENQP